MPFLLWLAGLVIVQNSAQILGSGSFDRSTLVNNLNVLWSEFEFVFFMKVVLLCLRFPMVQKSGHLDLSTTSYDHLNMYCSFGQFFPVARYLIQIQPKFRLTWGQL